MVTVLAVQCSFHLTTLGVSIPDTHETPGDCCLSRRRTTSNISEDSRALREKLLSGHSPVIPAFAGMTGLCRNLGAQFLEPHRLDSRLHGNDDIVGAKPACLAAIGTPERTRLPSKTRMVAGRRGRLSPGAGGVDLCRSRCRWVCALSSGRSSGNADRCRKR